MMYTIEKAIFVRKSQLDQISTGAKTTVRRAVLPTQYIAEPFDDNLILSVGEKHRGPVYTVGDIRPIEIGGKPPVSTPYMVRITKIEREPVALITDAEAKAEGWGGRNSFLLAWGSNNPMEITDCWILTFELVE